MSARRENSTETGRAKERVSERRGTGTACERERSPHFSCASELSREGESVRGKSSKVAGSGFSPLCQNPQRNFPIFVAGAQQAPDGKVDQEKPQKYTRTQTLTHTHSATGRETVGRPQHANEFSDDMYFFFAWGENSLFMCATHTQTATHTHTYS